MDFECDFGIIARLLSHRVEECNNGLLHLVDCWGKNDDVSLYGALRRKTHLFFHKFVA